MQKRSKFSKIYHALMLSCTVSSVLALTGCATGTVLEQIRVPSSHTKTVVSDALIAYGYAGTPIPEHENALILVGKKYNYLIEANEHESNNSILKDTVMQLDLKALSIASLSSPHEGSFVISKNNKTNTFNHTLRITFNKPITQVSEKEKQSLAKLEFTCPKDTKLQDYACYRNVSYTLSPIKKTNQDSQLQHTFKSPIPLQLKADYSSAINTLSKAPYVLLLPITVVVDIVTLPIQYAALSQAFSQGHH